MKTLPCPRCHGRGTVRLKDWIRETLALIGTGTTAEVMARKLRIADGAASMRLTRMFSAGLLARVREGKRWRYTRA